MNISPRRKRTAIICLLPLLIIGGGLLYVWTAPSRLQIPAPTPLPSPNVFDVYVAAAGAVVPANPPVDSINDAQKRTPQQAAVVYSAARRRAWIASNAAAWTLMEQAKGLPCRSPVMRGVVAPLPAWSQLRELARCQSIRVKEAKASGKWGESVNLGLDTVEMGLNIERGSVLIGSLVAVAVEAIGQYSIEDVPSHLSAGEAKAATKRLETLLAKAQPFSQVLGEEKWSMATNMGLSGGEIVKILYSPSITEMMDGLIAEADKPIGAQAPQAAPSGLRGTLATSLFPMMQKSFFNDARRKTSERLLLLRLALRAYRMERGAYPGKLAELSPTYLKSVPIDPFGKGEELRYRASGDSYLAWSVGPDGTDNKGVSVPPKRGQTRVVASANSKGDVVARP